MKTSLYNEEVTTVNALAKQKELSLDQIFPPSYLLVGWMMLKKIVACIVGAVFGYWLIDDFDPGM